MIHRIVGTAGHIDHGKTALIRALTGVNTDRLKEEQQRGITIDLGFAPLDLGKGEIVGVVDVPGHEKFIRNMLAGAGGIDTVLLVVAADESVKPQTREHFDICRLLGVSSGVVAITKSDLADQEMITIVRQEVEELVQGTFLEGSEMVPVSATTGDGVDAVRQALARSVRQAAVPGRADFPRLPVDRAVGVRGFGAVVTGTLLSGQLDIGDDLVVWPRGDKVRVRRLEVHGQQQQRAMAGQRVALNLAGTGKRTPHRGDLLAAPDRMRPASLLDVRLEILPSVEAGLGNQARVRLHIGTADVDARVRLLGDCKALRPGSAGPAQLRLAAPLAATVGDRFIVRRPSPALTWGGGRILDPAPLKHRGQEPEVAQQLARLQAAGLAGRLQTLLQEAGENGLSCADLVVRTGAGPESLTAELDKLAGAGDVLHDGSAAGWVLGTDAVAQIETRVLTLLTTYHQDHPLDDGMSVAELRQRSAAYTPDALVKMLFDRMVLKKKIRIVGEHAALGTHRVALSETEETMLAQVTEQVRSGGFDPPEPGKLLTAAGVDTGRCQALVRLLVDRGTLIRITATYLVHRDVLEELKQRLWEHRAQQPLIDVAAFKKLTQTSRRTAIPLLEYLDAEKVTTRRGDKRYIQTPRESGS